MLDGTKVATVLFDLLLHIRLKIRKPRIRIHRDLDLSVLNRFEPSFPSNVVFLLYGLVEEVLGRIAEARDSVQSPIVCRAVYKASRLTKSLAASLLSSSMYCRVK